MLTLTAVASLSVSGTLLGATAQASPLAAVGVAAAAPVTSSAPPSAPPALLPEAAHRAVVLASENRRDAAAGSRAEADQAARAEAERVARAEAERVAAEQAAAVEQAAAAEQARRDQAAREAASRSRGGGSAKAIAADLVAARGWSAGQFDCLDSLWTKESNWKVHADNPTSSAYGIPQALPGSKMASAGSDWRTNAHTQISWGLGYIADRYGSPCGAWSHSQSHNWY
jgi:hypothetical protein